MNIHKDTLAVALVEASGRSRATITIPNNKTGHAELVVWLQEQGPGSDSVSRAPTAMVTRLRWRCAMPASLSWMCHPH